MKDKEFLDDLFDKARQEQPLFDPNDPIKNLPNTQTGTFRLNVKHWLLAASIVVAVYLGFSVWESGTNKNQNPESIVQTDTGENTDTSIILSNVNDSGKLNAIDIETTHRKDENFGGHGQEIYASNKQTSDHKKQLDSNKQAVMLIGDLEKLQAMQTMPAEVFEIDAWHDTILTTGNKNRYYFEGQGLVDKSGKVVKGSVQVEIKECEKMSHCIREDLSTNDNGELLQTAGMYHIRITKGKDTLNVRTGYEIGMGFNREIPEQFDLYYGQRSANNDLDWNLDPLGKKPTPIVVVTKYEYEKVTDFYFYKNFRFDKSNMIELIDSSWLNHFTSDNRIVKGYRSCNGLSGPYLNACQKFNDDLASELAMMDIFNVNSRMTYFGFTCMSKNKYAYAMAKGSIDSANTYVPPSDFNYLSIPVFFPITTGWLNLDCMPAIELKWGKIRKVAKTDVKVKIPEGIQYNAYLYLPEQNSIARCRNTESGTITFNQVPAGQSARLIITSYYHDQFYIHTQDCTITGNELIASEFEKFDQIEDYLERLNQLDIRKTL